MTTMNNGDFPIGYPEFEIPTTPGHMLNNLFDATLAGVFGDEKNISSDYVKNLLGSVDTEFTKGDNINFYTFRNFEITNDSKQYIMGITFERYKHKYLTLIRVHIPEYLQTHDMLFENFTKQSKFKWIETDYPMTIEAMAIRQRTTNPYGFRRFDTSFERDEHQYDMGIITTETAFISSAIVKISAKQ